MAKWVGKLVCETKVTVKSASNAMLAKIEDIGEKLDQETAMRVDIERRLAQDLHASVGAQGGVDVEMAVSNVSRRFEERFALADALTNSLSSPSLMMHKLFSIGSVHRKPRNQGNSA